MSHMEQYYRGYYWLNQKAQIAQIDGTFNNTHMGLGQLFLSSKSDGSTDGDNAA